METLHNKTEKKMITLTLEEYISAIKSQDVDTLDATFKCPKCETLQSISDLIKAGAGKNKDEVLKFIGFSCIGRFDSKKGCDWTLGGLFQIHELEVIYPDGSVGPRFIPIGADQCL